MSDLLDPLFGAGEVDAVFAPASSVQAMLDVEVALAVAEARLGMIPAPAALSIRSAGRADGFDLARLAEAAGRAGNLAIPLVNELTARVREMDPDAAQYVHWGATSQDILDTALVRQVRTASAAIIARVDRAALRALELASQHRATPIAGRTWLQQATPTSFGLKLAGIGDALRRSARRLEDAVARASVVQVGGAAGNLAAFGGRGIELMEALGRELDLAAPPVPWHAHRDRLAEVAGALGILAGGLGKIGRDVGLLAQTEVGEVAERSPGGSSAMPQKQNPVRAAVAVAAAIRAPGLVATLLAALPQEHERGFGGWPAEWETLPQLIRLVGGSARAIEELLDGLIVDPGRMAANLESSRGLPYAEAVTIALAAPLGKERARALVTAACETSRATGRQLRDILADDPTVGLHLSPAALAERFDPARQLGEASALIDRAQGGGNA